MLGLFVIKVLVILVGVLLSIAWITVLERQGLLGIQRRRGPNSVGWNGQLQALGDGLKLILKESILLTRLSHGLFKWSPIVTFSVMVTCWMFIPLNENMIVDISITMISLLAFSSIGVYGVLLGGYSSNSRYGFLGGIRSSSQMILYEVSLGIVVGTVSILSGGLVSLSELIEFQKEGRNIQGVELLGVLLVVMGIAETNRHPFDLPEAESELVSGYNVEYASTGFVLYFLGEYGSILLIAMYSQMLMLGLNHVLLVMYTILIVYVIIWLRGVLPRYRYDQLIMLGWKSYIPVTMGVLLLVLGVVHIS